MTTEREEFEKFEKMFLSGNFADVDYAIANPKILWSWHQQSVEKAVEKERERIVKDLENEHDNGFDDGVDQAEKHVKKEILSKIENKFMFVKAYENGPMLTDSLVITMDDWLEIKSERKSKVSYSLTPPQLEVKQEK